MIGLVVDRVSYILSIRFDRIQQLPDFETTFDPAFSCGIISLDHRMVCFLKLNHLFASFDDRTNTA